MPRANWGVTTEDIDNFDRDAQFKPYAGPKPPTGVVYCFSIVKLTHHAAPSPGKFPQMRAGLVLEPRTEDERKYKGFYITKFMSIAPDRPSEGKKGTGFQYVPFLDALGVSSNDFTEKTLVDEDGAIKRIGPWRNEGDTLILAQLVNGTRDRKNEETGRVETVPTIEVGWVGEASGVVFEITDDAEAESEEEVISTDVDWE